jgi:hypothetical protein
VLQPSSIVAVSTRIQPDLLGLATTDLTLLHHPCDTNADTINAYVTLQGALGSGLTKAIGVSNFNADLLAQLLAGDLPLSLKYKHVRDFGFQATLGIEPCLNSLKVFVEYELRSGDSDHFSCL